LTTLCRDCGAYETAAQRRERCAACGSPRLVCHSELCSLAVAHVDCDAFYASVEKRDRPELADRPVIIGGGARGVVLACCYVARLYGVRSAMPMFKALAACPDAVVIRPEMAKYHAVGREVRAEMQRLTPLVEPLSIDEAFLHLGRRRNSARRLPRPAPREARQAGRNRALTVSIGLPASSR
jgi:DNA polymerase-4